jgi:hypothetical protein
MQRHIILVEVWTEEPETTESLASDIAFTMGLESGVAGGYIGDPEEHAFYGASRVDVSAVKKVPQ